MLKIVLIIIGVVIIALLLTRKGQQAVKDGVEGIGGICASVLNQTARKNANKQKVVALLAEKGEMNNSDIREALGIASRTVVKYMDELEREGKVEQIGATGKMVIYRLKQV